MKHWSRTLPCKIICFILCIVFLCIAAASVVGAVLMISAEFYTLPKEYVIESEHYTMLHSASNNIVWMTMNDESYHYYSNYDYSPEVTNIRYQIVSPDGETVGSNTDNTDFQYSFEIVLYKDKDGYYTEFDYIYDDEPIENGDVFTVNMSLAEGLPVKDEYAFVKLLFDVVYALLYWIYPIGLFSLALSVTCFIMLVCASARRPDSDELHPGLFNKVPIDLFIALLGLAFLVLIQLIWDVWYTGDILADILTGVLIAVGVNIALGLCMSIAARIKQRTLFSNTLVWMILKLIWKILKFIGKLVLRILKGIRYLCLSIPLIWKTMLFVFGNLITDLLLLILAYNWDEASFFLWTIKTLLVLPVIIYGAIMLRKLETGGKAIAKGDLSYKVDTKGMLWDFKCHGENLNSISVGMAKAVEERLRSERMKAELITNVSHDIKTPLTSIINYSGLIAEEECTCEKHREYSEVLVRKSEHLKRLLDDLVEVSKATTGNLEVSLSPCEAGVLLQQAAGEFEERCRAQNLELITSFPETGICIMADSRRIWRVFENLMSNACKYSLTGSRVYLSLAQDKGDAVFIFRNTSRAPLNISPEELTARFVRGDSSRSTEGNGLGLSIAKSLTELQGGRMDITIDGDLFKVTLRFPII